MHQTGMLAALCENPRDDLFLANVALGDVLDRHAGRRRQRCGSIPNPVS
jgi:hypothetical protein